VNRHASVLRRDTWGLHALTMAFTHYKARGAGKLPICVICGGPGEGRRERVELTHGVHVWPI
jgi:hypothetical protein